MPNAKKGSIDWPAWIGAVCATSILFVSAGGYLLNSRIVPREIKVNSDIEKILERLDRQDVKIKKNEEDIDKDRIEFMKYLREISVSIGSMKTDFSHLKEDIKEIKERINRNE